MLSTIVGDAYYIPITGISNSVTWRLNKPYLASLAAFYKMISIVVFWTFMPMFL